MNILKRACKFSKALIAIGVLLLVSGAFFCKSSYTADATPQITNPLEIYEKKEEAKQDNDSPLPALVDEPPEQNIRVQQRSIKRSLVRIQKKLEKRKERKNAPSRASK